MILLYITFFSNTAILSEHALHRVFALMDRQFIQQHRLDAELNEMFWCTTLTTLL